MTAHQCWGLPQPDPDSGSAARCWIK